MDEYANLRDDRGQKRANILLLWVECVWEDTYPPTSELISKDNDKYNSKCTINMIIADISDICGKT